MLCVPLSVGTSTSSVTRSFVMYSGIGRKFIFVLIKQTALGTGSPHLKINLLDLFRRPFKMSANKPKVLG